MLAEVSALLAGSCRVASSSVTANTKLHIIYHLHEIARLNRVNHRLTYKFKLNDVLCNIWLAFLSLSQIHGK